MKTQLSPAHEAAANLAREWSAAKETERDLESLQAQFLDAMASGDHDRAERALAELDGVLLAATIRERFAGARQSHDATPRGAGTGTMRCAGVAQAEAATGRPGASTGVPASMPLGADPLAALSLADRVRRTECERLATELGGAL